MSSINIELKRMAAQAVLFGLDSSYDVVQDRLQRFLADFGAVGNVLMYYEETGNLEKTCISYWESRLEPESLRLEDLLSTMLIGVASSIIATLLLQSGESLFPKIYKRIAPEKYDRQLLEKISRLKSEREKHCRTMIKLYLAKLSTHKKSADDLSRKLLGTYRALKSGAGLENFLSDIHLDEPKNVVDYLDDLVRGVLLTEEGRQDGWAILQKIAPECTVLGMPLSPYFSHGWLITEGFSRATTIEKNSSLYDVDELIRHIKRKDLSTGRTEKKIVPIFDADFRNLFESPHFNKVLEFISGFIVLDAGMTGHAAVFCRGIRIGCIGLNPDELSNLVGFKFAILSDGIAKFYKDVPEELALGA